MISRSRVWLIFMITLAIILAQANLASSQRIILDKGEQRDNGENDRSGRRNRNRDKENANQGVLQTDGSESQNVQQAIENLQGNINPQTTEGSGEAASAAGQVQSKKQFKKSQQWQNWQHQGGGQGKKKKHKHHDWDNWSIHFGGAAPFSVEWYEHHPHAWHHDHHDHDGWEIATAAGVLAWLGWHGHHHHGHVDYHPVPVETYYVESGPAFDPHAGEWMTLGVFSLMTGPGDSGTRVLELAIDKHGHIRGNYYDAITNANYTVTGRIHEPTQYVQWTLDKNRRLTFYAPLSELTQPEGTIHVQFPSGRHEDWQLARMEYASN